MLKKLSYFLLAIISAAALSITAFAANETKDLFTLDQSYNMAVSILFDKEKPDVSFINPAGAVIGGDSLTYEEGDGWIQYYIPNAMSGAWKITYDKKSNTTFEIGYSSYMNPISISSFSFEGIRSNRLPVTFSVSGEDGAYYQWEIYAVITDGDSTTGERLLSNGSAAFGDEVSRDVDISGLADFAGYKLRLDVWQKNGAEEVYDSKITDKTFAVSGGTALKAIDDFHTELNLTDSKLIVDWGEWSLYSEYIIAVFDDSKSTAEPFYYTEIIDGRTWAEALFDTEAPSIRIDITGRRNGENSKTKSKTISLDTGVEISAQTSGLTSSSQVRIDYSTVQNVIADLIFNDRTETVNLAGTGNFSISLTETYNKGEMRYSLSDKSTVYVVGFEITVDSVPPALRLPENKTAIFVSGESFTIAGITDSDAVVKVGDETTTVNPDGTFVSTVMLADGENIIPVTSTDPAGNVSSQNVIITRKDLAQAATTAAAEEDKGFWENIKTYIPIIVSFVTSITLFAAVLFISNGFAKAKSRLLFVFRTARNITIVLGSLCVIAEGYFLWKYMSLKSFSESDDYFELAQASIDSAYNKLGEVDLQLRMLAYFGMAIGGFAVLAVIFGLVILLLKKRIIKKSAANQAPETAAEAVIEAAVSEAEIKENIVLPETTEIICPNCGAKYSEPVVFCENCGTKLG